MSHKEEYDYLIVGAGIIGLTIARELIIRFPNAKICLIEKEDDIATHASGRNSGVLHAGFYYTADSLKAKFTVEGCHRMTAYCREQRLKINPCGKFVVATNASELDGLSELKRRGDVNKVELHWMNSQEIQKIDKNVKTHETALFSPNTATVDPVEICRAIRRELIEANATIKTSTAYIYSDNQVVTTSSGLIFADYIINCAGLYADQIARNFGYAKDLIIIPFKGLYLKNSESSSGLRTNVYPVPNLQNPFLGVHFTVTVDGTVKIGPTAIPAFYRENYVGLKKFRLSEFIEVSFYEAILFMTNAFGFRSLAFSEMKKYKRSFFIKLAEKLVHDMSHFRFNTWSTPGIRAQLLNTKTLELVQDFIVAGDQRSFHVLNAVSPAFTCSFPMASYIVDQISEKRRMP